MKYWFAALLLLLMAGCRSTTSPTTIPTNPAAQLQGLTAEATLEEAVDQLRVVVDGVELTLYRPEQWEFYPTDYGVVLTEQIDSVATEGVLSGILTHVWLPPLDDFNIPSADGTNLAWQFLTEIIENPDYIGSAAVSPPQAFTWGGLDAAYYLLDNGDGNLSIVIGVVVPNSTRLVTCSVGAPVEQAQRIREMLPVLFANMTINGVVLDGAELDQLPDPLDFPRRSSEADLGIAAS
ncbi:MAG: hypothetical protein SF029_08015 [bacterium]|nr:hypothetical protein [bacterium]